MSLALLSLSVLVVLSNFMLENVEGQDSSTVFQALQTLTKAVERLEAKIHLQTTSMNIIEAKVEIQANKLSRVEALLTDSATKEVTQANLLNNLGTEIDMQAAILRDLKADSKVQNDSLDNLTAMQVNFLSIVEEKFSLLGNLVNNVMNEDQTQSTLLNNLGIKVDTQAALLTSLNANVTMQATSLSYLEAESKLQKISVNNLQSTGARLTNFLSNLETKADMQATLLNHLQAQSEVQGTLLNNLVAEVEWHEPVAQFQTNRTIVAVQGDDVEMWCVVRGTPLPDVRWTRENGRLESNRVAIENNGKVLRIKNARLSDDGSYVCVAANGVGTPATHSVRLVVYGEADQCSRIIKSDSGSLAIKTLSTSCLWVINLQKTTGFRLELDPLMMKPIFAIPEQIRSNSNVQYIQLSGSKNASHEFDGKSLAIVVPPGHERTTLSWTGLDLDGSGVSSSTKLEQEMEGMLEWESRGDGIENIFWVFDHNYKFTKELNWTLNITSTASDHESSCESISFSVLQIRRDGNISSVQRICDGSSKGSLKLETSSRVLVLLHIKSVEAARSKLHVSWTHHDKPLKKNVGGIAAGTEGGGAFIIPFNSTQSKTVSSNKIYGLAFDWNSLKIWYLRYQVGIVRSNLDGSESEILMPDQKSTLMGMTIEPTSGNFYYGNRSSETIRVCDKNAKKCSTIASSSDLSYINDFAVHLSEGYLFWSIYDKKVVRANLDGSNGTVLIHEKEVWGIYLDEPEDRLYWGSARGIGSSDFNGQDIRMIPNMSIKVQAIAVNGDKVYYAIRDPHSIRVISKSGTNSRLVTQLTNTIYHMALFGTQVSKKPANPCETSECAHLCVLVTRWSYRCLCPDNMQLNADEKTCRL